MINNFFNKILKKLGLKVTICYSTSNYTIYKEKNGS